MSERKEPLDLEIEALVCAHLAQQERTVDAAGMLARVRTGLAASASKEPHEALTRSRGRLSRSLTYSFRLAFAAAVLLAIVWAFHLDLGQASATTLVREAQRVHALPIDRCYGIETQLEPALMDSYRVLPVQRKARLWTRGDRFWMESLQGNRAWSMGRDELGRIWFASVRGAGFRFEANEVPEPLRMACELRSMRIESLLRELLADFDLREERCPRDSAGATRVVRALLKPDRQRALRAVTMEMDAQTNVLKRVVLSRTHSGGAASTVTFTFVGEDHQKDDVYRLEGHLNPEACVYSTEDAPRRLQRLQRLFESARP